MALPTAYKSGPITVLQATTAEFDQLHYELHSWLDGHAEAPESWDTYLGRFKTAVDKQQQAVSELGGS